MKNTLSAWVGEMIAFIRNKNNPTGVTADQAGTYTKEQITAMAAGKLDLVDFPIAYWGSSLSFVINTTSTGYKFWIQTAVPAILGGVRATLPATELDIPAGAGTRFLYLKATNGALSYFFSATFQAESSTLMYLGSVVVDGSNVTSKSIGPVVALGGKRLAIVKQGSSIPVTSGGPNETGTFPWD